MDDFGAYWLAGGAVEYSWPLVDRIRRSWTRVDWRVDSRDGLKSCQRSQPTSMNDKIFIKLPDKLPTNRRCARFHRIVFRADSLAAMATK
eukprot:SAG31_NODE_5781_length_2331_cov_1.138889_1_plen_90_part_00